MNDFPFNRNHDDSSATVSNILACRAFLVCLLMISSQAIPYPNPFYKIPLPYLSSSLPVSHEIESYFPVPYADTGWTCPEELWSETSVIEQKPSHIDTSTSIQPQHIDDFSPSCLDSANLLEPSNCNIDLAKVTEYETWNLPSSDGLTDYGGNHDWSPSMRSPSRRHSFTLSAMGDSPNRNFTVTRANSRSDKPRGRLQPSSSSESQSLSKRRHSSMSRQSKPVITQNTGPEAEPQEANREPEARPLAKSSHSIVERRYRESLNTKITQLDQTLSSIRRPSGQTGGPKSDEHPYKTRKAEVLTEAMRYVLQAELESEARIKEIDFLRLRVAALEKLVNCGDCALLKQSSDQQIIDATNF